jgi:hypothetical protein
MMSFILNPLCKYALIWYVIYFSSLPQEHIKSLSVSERTRAGLSEMLWNSSVGNGSKPCSPGEHRNRWQTDVHPLTNCIYRYWSIASYEIPHSILVVLLFIFSFLFFTPSEPALVLQISHIFIHQNAMDNAASERWVWSSTCR